MRIIFLFFALLAPLAAQEPVVAVQQVLQQQQAAWNHHDLEAFMAGYWNSPELTFFGTKKTSGWQGTLDRYRKTYQGEGHEMGKLEFSDLQIEALAPNDGICSRRLEVDHVRWQDAAWTVHPGVSPLFRRMEDRARSHFAAGVSFISSPALAPGFPPTTRHWAA